ncbi:MAG: hypothetical protein ACJAVK_002992 [Akkermansiaceae bacterium]|jgi:hypothetical protein
MHENSPFDQQHLELTMTEQQSMEPFVNLKIQSNLLRRAALWLGLALAG